MNEKPASWNNISRNKIPDMWNSSNINLSPEAWTKQTELPDIWNANRHLPDNWSSYSSDSPTTWNVSGMLFDKWGRGGLLPENWGNSGSIPCHNDRSERHMTPNSRAGNISNIADRAQKAVGKVAGAHAAAAKLAGGAVSKLSKKAVDYARSDDTAEKIDLAKGKVSAAFTGIKSKASAFASEHKRSVNEVSADIDEEIAAEEFSNISDDIDINEEFTESEEYTALDDSEIMSDDETISDEENYDYDEDEELSEYQDEESFENDEYDVQDDSEIISADESQYFEENIDEDYYEESNSNRMSNSDYAPQNVHYAADKKSHVVYVLTGVIALLIVTAGVLGGMLIMKNKGDYNKDKYIFVESSVNENIAVETNVNENAKTEAPDITTEAITEIITESTTEKPEVLIVQDEYSSEEVSTMFSAYISENPDPNRTYEDQEYGYALIDLNDDGTQKLLITTDTMIEENSPGIIGAYKIKNKKLTMLWISDIRCLGKLCEDNIIYSSYIYGTGHGITIYKYLFGDSLEKIENIEYNASTIDVSAGIFNAEYSYDNTTTIISEDEANTILDKYKAMKFEAKPLRITSSEPISKKETTSDPYFDIKQEILYSVDNEEYSGKNSHIENAPSDMIFYSTENRSSLNISNPIVYEGPSTNYSQISIYQDRFDIVGENSSWYYIQWYEGTGRFAHPCYGYLNKNSININNSDVINETEVYECNKYGRINTHGGHLPSITIDYIIGKSDKMIILRDSLGNGWHIQAVRSCNSMSITWYEIYDADDGDYYGWIDGSFIDFD